MVGSGAVAAALTNVFNVSQKKVENLRIATNTALRVALALEAAARINSRTYLAIQAWDNAEPWPEEDRRTVIAAPVFDPAWDWSHVDPALTSEAMGMLAYSESANARVRQGKEWDLDLLENLGKEAAVTGYRFWLTAVALRDYYRLPTLTSVDLIENYHNVLAVVALPILKDLHK